MLMPSRFSYSISKIIRILVVLHPRRQHCRANEVLFLLTDLYLFRFIRILFLLLSAARHFPVISVRTKNKFFLYYVVFRASQVLLFYYLQRRNFILFKMSFLRQLSCNLRWIRLILLWKFLSFGAIAWNLRAEYNCGTKL